MDIIVRPVSASVARDVVRRYHYSGSVVSNSQIHMGVYLGGELLGALQFGPSMDKEKIQALVSDTPWNGFIELNRMAFSDRLPKNSESRALGVALRLLKKHASHVQWVISFADGARCGHGTIYQASNFVLTGIKPNTQVWRNEEGHIISRMTVTEKPKLGAAASMAPYEKLGYRPMPGFQLRYVYFIDPTARGRLTVPAIPFSDVDRLGAAMYKGDSIVRVKQATSGDHPDSGGAAPTHTLHSSPEGN